MEQKIGERCANCDSCRVVYSAPDGWQFRGCYHEPYRGKWVAEIMDCPKEKKNINESDKKRGA